MNTLSWIFSVIPVVLLVLGALAINRKAYKHSWGCLYIAFALEIFIAGLIAAIHSLIGPAPSLKIFFENWISDSAGWTIVNFHELTNPAISRIFGCGETSIYALTLIVLQMILVAFIVGARWYKTKKPFDPIAIIIIIMMVLNAFF